MQLTRGWRGLVFFWVLLLHSAVSAPEYFR